MSGEEIIAHEDLLKIHNIQRSSYHGNAFEGNTMRKLVENGLAFPLSILSLLRDLAI